MSWFARSIFNTLKLDDEDEDTEPYHVNKNTGISTNQKHEQEDDDDSSSLSPGRGVKEDLSEFTKTLTRQFRGVASFLAPPLPPDLYNERSELSDPEASAQEAISGIRRDFAEIRGRFRSGISKLSNNIDVSEITKMASDFLQLESEDEDYDSIEGDGAVGVTDEVVSFARDIAMHPETWLDFPLPVHEDDDEDFDLCEAQQEHVLAVECLAPRLAALRIELCPGYMSESSFWKIYFVLLHPRLERDAAELLSTPEIVKARASLTHELKNRPYAESKKEGLRSSSYSENIPDYVPSGTKSKSVPLEISAIETAMSTVSANAETLKHPVQSDEIRIVDKPVVKEETHNKTKAGHQNVRSKTISNMIEAKDEEDTDDWLKEESSEILISRTTVQIENDGDVSFSDLEDDDENVPINYKRATYGSDSSTKDSRGWVQWGRSSTDSGKDSDLSTIEHAGSQQVSIHDSEAKESNDWLDVVDIDVA